jgi:hypothetical protein
VTESSGVRGTSAMKSIAALPGGSLRAASSAERLRGVSVAGWVDRSYLELAGTPDALRALAAALVEVASAGEQRVVLDVGPKSGFNSREWSALAVTCLREPREEASPAVQVALIERSSDAHRRDKLVIEVQNRLSSTVRISGFRFETDALKSAGNADLTIHGGRSGRFSMFVPNDTRELELWVDGFTDLAGAGAPWTFGHMVRTPLPARASRSPLEDRLM